jgi:hypothetical protein
MQKSVSLVLVYYIFALIFLNLLPWLHYSYDIRMWRREPILEDTYLQVNILLLVSHAIVQTFHLTVRRTAGAPERLELMKKVAGPLPSLTLLLISGGGLFMLLFINNFAWESILFRGLEYDFRVAVFSSSALNLFLNMVCRMLPFFCFLYAAMRIKGGTTLKIVLFSFLLVAVFPTGVARYLVGMIYIPLALIYFPIFRSGGLFATLLIGLLLFMFPFLDQFREFAGFYTLQFLPSIEYFYAPHFDAYENFASAIELGFVTYGWQLLGVVLFYVPRTFWPGKPIGSGQEMAEQSFYVFDNISMPFLGEGFVNFGSVGVLLFATALAYGMAVLDRYFAASVLYFRDSSYLTAFYFYLIGALFFLLRGDLLSSFAYISSGVVVALVVTKLMGTIDRVKLI